MQKCVTVKKRKKKQFKYDMKYKHNLTFRVPRAIRNTTHNIILLLFGPSHNKNYYYDSFELYFFSFPGLSGEKNFERRNFVTSSWSYGNSSFNFFFLILIIYIM